jgi:hypothetical protein
MTLPIRRKTVLQHRFCGIPSVLHPRLLCLLNRHMQRHECHHKDILIIIKIDCYYNYDSFFIWFIPQTGACIPRYYRLRLRRNGVKLFNKRGDNFIKTVWLMNRPSAGIRFALIDTYNQ